MALVDELWVSPSDSAHCLPLSWCENGCNQPLSRRTVVRLDASREEGSKFPGLVRLA